MKTDLSVAPAPALTNACIQTGAGRGPVRHRRAHCGFWTLASWLMLLVWMTGAPQSARAGTWTPLANGAPNGVQLMLLLTDGTVMTHDTTLGGVANGGVESGWSRLNPTAMAAT